MRRFRAVGLVVALIAGFIGVSAAPAQAKTITVASGGSIQNAVNAARSGDTIVLAPNGTYAGGIVISKDGITIRGNNSTIAGPSALDSECRLATKDPVDNPDGEDNGFCVFPPNFDLGRSVRSVEIASLTVRDFGGIGIVAFGASGLDVHDVTAIDNDEYGITAFGSTSTQFVHNSTSGGGEAGIYVGDSANSGTTVANNVTYDNQFGIFLRDSGHGHITGNSAHDNCVGIIAVDTDGNGDSGWWGISGNVTNHNNRACDASEEGPGLSGFGILLADSQQNQVTKNIVMNNNRAPGSTVPMSAGIAVVQFGGVSDGNAVTANRLSGNLDSDLLWDGNGSQRFNRNTCGTSIPDGLC